MREGYWCVYNCPPHPTPRKQLLTAHDQSSEAWCVESQEDGRRFPCFLFFACYVYSVSASRRQPKRVAYQPTAAGEN